MSVNLIGIAHQKCHDLFTIMLFEMFDFSVELKRSYLAECLGYFLPYRKIKYYIYHERSFYILYPKRQF